MSTYDMLIQEGEKKGRIEGEKKGRVEGVKVLLKANVPESFIAKEMGFTLQEVRRIRREMINNGELPAKK